MSKGTAETGAGCRERLKLGNEGGDVQPTRSRYISLRTSCALDYPGVVYLPSSAGQVPRRRFVPQAPRKPYENGFERGYCSGVTRFAPEVGSVFAAHTNAWEPAVSAPLSERPLGTSYCFPALRQFSFSPFPSHSFLPPAQEN